MKLEAFKLERWMTTYELAEEYSVMLAPGAAFGYEGYLRIGIGVRPEVFRSGLEQTARCLRHLLATGVERTS